jgi:hypothetical protein
MNPDNNGRIDIYDIDNEIARDNPLQAIQDEIQTQINKKNFNWEKYLTDTILANSQAGKVLIDKLTIHPNEKDPKKLIERNKVREILIKNLKIKNVQDLLTKKLHNSHVQNLLRDNLHNSHVQNLLRDNLHNSHVQNLLINNIGEEGVQEYVLNLLRDNLHNSHVQNLLINNIVEEGVQEYVQTLLRENLDNSHVLKLLRENLHNSHVQNLLRENLDNSHVLKLLRDNIYNSHVLKLLRDNIYNSHVQDLITEIIEANVTSENLKNIINSSTNEYLKNYLFLKENGVEFDAEFLKNISARPTLKYFFMLQSARDFLQRPQFIQGFLQHNKIREELKKLRETKNNIGESYSGIIANKEKIAQGYFSKTKSQDEFLENFIARFFRTYPLFMSSRATELYISKLQSKVDNNNDLEPAILSYLYRQDRSLFGFGLFKPLKSNKRLEVNSTLVSNFLLINITQPNVQELLTDNIEKPAVAKFLANNIGNPDVAKFLADNIGKPDVAKFLANNIGNPDVATFLFFLESQSVSNVITNINQSQITQKSDQTIISSLPHDFQMLSDARTGEKPKSQAVAEYDYRTNKLKSITVHLGSSDKNRLKKLAKWFAEKLGEKIDGLQTDDILVLNGDFNFDISKINEDNYKDLNFIAEMFAENGLEIDEYTLPSEVVEKVRSAGSQQANKALKIDKMLKDLAFKLKKSPKDCKDLKEANRKKLIELTKKAKQLKIRNYSMTGGLDHPGLLSHVQDEIGGIEISYSSNTISSKSYDSDKLKKAFKIFNNPQGAENLLVTLNERLLKIAEKNLIENNIPSDEVPWSETRTIELTESIEKTFKKVDNEPGEQAKAKLKKAQDLSSKIAEELYESDEWKQYVENLNKDVLLEQLSNEIDSKAAGFFNNQEGKVLDAVAELQEHLLNNNWGKNSSEDAKLLGNAIMANQECFFKSSGMTAEKLLLNIHSTGFLNDQLRSVTSLRIQLFDGLTLEKIAQFKSRKSFENRCFEQHLGYIDSYLEKILKLPKITGATMINETDFKFIEMKKGSHTQEHINRLRILQKGLKGKNITQAREFLDKLKKANTLERENIQSKEAKEAKAEVHKELKSNAAMRFSNTSNKTQSQSPKTSQNCGIQ